MLFDCNFNNFANIEYTKTPKNSIQLNSIRMTMSYSSCYNPLDMQDKSYCFPSKTPSYRVHT